MLAKKLKINIDKITLLTLGHKDSQAGWELQLEQIEGKDNVVDEVDMYCHTFM